MTMKLIFDIAAGRIGIEGDGEELLSVLQLARDIAPSLAHIEIHTIEGRPTELRETSQNQAISARQAGRTNGLIGPVVASGQTLRQFVRPFRFDSNAERIVGIAYYKKTYEGIDSFSPKDMSSWFSVSGFVKPSQMPVAIFNAGKNLGYVESVSHGKWRLTTNGENLIVGKLNQAEEGTGTGS
jgi:hypothetical protein